MKPTLVIHGALATAFTTRRKELLAYGLAELRRNAAAGTLVGEELDRVLNLVEVLSTDLWETRDCLSAVNQLILTSLDASDGASSITKRSLTAPAL